MCDLTLRAFDVADRYRNPVVVLADALIGQMMEAVDFPTTAVRAPRHDWAVRGDAATRRNLITSIHLSPEDLERHNRRLMAKYAGAARELPAWRTYRTDDAEVLMVGYGIIARVLRSAVDLARQRGINVGLIRPVLLWPFPSAAIARAAERADRLLVVELSDGQMVEDVRLAVNGSRPVAFYGRQGGMVPSPAEILDVLAATREERHVHEPFA
jgi:pyruvate/2-oxoacid:ferredoxin oxidoreductase alpha subunit